MSVTLSMELLSLYRERRASGASLKMLATELGIPWQRLDKALRHGLPGGQPISTPAPAMVPNPMEPLPPPEPETAVLPKPVSDAPGLLTEKYRPRNLDSLFGQPGVVRQLKAFTANPYSVAFLFGGETGTGKTSAALALAQELGCDLDQMEFGGVHVIASGEQSADAVRACAERMWLQPMAGSGWKVFIINEADRMHIQAETVWLDRLENLPRKTVVVLTTNFIEKLSNRFRDRCVVLRFESDAHRIFESVKLLVTGIWKAETGHPIPPDTLTKVLTEATQQGRLSFRRVVQYLQPLLPPAKKISNRKGSAK